MIGWYLIIIMPLNTLTSFAFLYSLSLVTHWVTHSIKWTQISVFMRQRRSHKLLEYKRRWIQHVNRMPRNRLPRVMKHYSPVGRRNHGRPLKRLLDMWDRNVSTSGPTAWHMMMRRRRRRRRRSHKLLAAVDTAVNPSSAEIYVQKK